MDEANQPLTLMNEVLGLGERNAEIWGYAISSASTAIRPLQEPEVPATATITLEAGAELSLPGAVAGERLRAYTAREKMVQRDGTVLARFADGVPAVTRHQFGKGAAIVVGLWPGLAYSEYVRSRPDFDMEADYLLELRSLIAGPALARNVYRPVVPEASQVEAVLLEKDGKRSIALMNWNHQTVYEKFQPHKQLRVLLPGVQNFSRIRSLKHGVLPVQGEGANRSVVLPQMDEVDLLVVE